MLMYVIAALLIAACGLGAVPMLRRASSSGVRATRPVVAKRQPPVALELPVELQHLPEPPVLTAAHVEILEPEEILRRLRQLELGVAELGPALPEHEKIVAAALAAIGDATTQRRYSPRRPSLLPQLMRAINDEDVSRRELSALIARDPALVGSLLKMANSAFYRVTSRQIETIERAGVLLGSEGLRSLMG